jgi:hypothetical protein
VTAEDAEARAGRVEEDAVVAVGERSVAAREIAGDGPDAVEVKAPRAVDGQIELALAGVGGIDGDGAAGGARQLGEVRGFAANARAGVEDALAGGHTEDAPDELRGDVLSGDVAVLERRQLVEGAGAAEEQRLGQVRRLADIADERRRDVAARGSPQRDAHRKRRRLVHGGRCRFRVGRAEGGDEAPGDPRRHGGHRLETAEEIGRRGRLALRGQPAQDRVAEARQARAAELADSGHRVVDCGVGGRA